MKHLLMASAAALLLNLSAASAATELASFKAPSEHGTSQVEMQAANGLIHLASDDEGQTATGGPSGGPNQG